MQLTTLCFSPQCRYLLNFTATDETGEARFFAYDEVAKLIVQKDCDIVLNPLKLALGLPQPLQAVLNTRFLFSVSLTENSFSSRTRRQYLIKHILDKPGRHPSALSTAGPAMIPQPATAPTSSSAHTTNLLQITHTPEVQHQILQVSPASESVCQFCFHY